MSKRELNITPHYGCSRVGAGTTIKSDANEVVPAPRLELGTGSDNICALRCILSAALEEIERGQTRHAKAILNTLKEVLS